MVTMRRTLRARIGAAIASVAASFGGRPLVRAKILGIALLCAAGSGALAAETLRVPGTRAQMEPPAGFTASQRFPGFERATAQASIVVTEIPAPSAAMIKGMSKDALAAKGMEVLSSTPVKMDGREAILLEIAQSASGVPFRKWMLVSGDATTSVLVVGTFPQSAAAELSAPMRAAVLSTRWSEAGASDPFDGLPFRVEAVSGLKLAGRVSNMLMFNESGAQQTVNPGDALYVVGPSVGNPPAGGLREFAEARARQTTQVRDLKIVEGRDITVDGLPAYELLGEAADRRSGTPVRFYQVIAADPGGYYIMQGIAGTDRADVAVAQFRAMTNGFRRVTN